MDGWNNECFIGLILCACDRQVAGESPSLGNHISVGLLSRPLVLRKTPLQGCWVNGLTLCSDPWLHSHQYICLCMFQKLSKMGYLGETPPPNQPHPFSHQCPAPSGLPRLVRGPCGTRDVQGHAGADRRPPPTVRLRRGGRAVPQAQDPAHQPGGVDGTTSPPPQLFSISIYVIKLVLKYICGASEKRIEMKKFEDGGTFDIRVVWFQVHRGC